MCREAAYLESVDAAIQHATGWIQQNPEDARVAFLHTTDTPPAQALGRVLHTIQDREAHRNRCVDTYEPETMYGHCRQSMDDPGANPWFWDAYYKVDAQTFSKI